MKISKGFVIELVDDFSYEEDGIVFVDSEKLVKALMPSTNKEEDLCMCGCEDGNEEEDREKRRLNRERYTLDKYLEENNLKRNDVNLLSVNLVGQYLADYHQDLGEEGLMEKEMEFVNDRDATEVGGQGGLGYVWL